MQKKFPKTAMLTHEPLRDRHTPWTNHQQSPLMMSTVNIIILLVDVIFPFVTLSFLMTSFWPPVQTSLRHSYHLSPTADVWLLCLTHNPILNSDSYQFVNKYGWIISLSTSAVQICEFVMAYTKCYLSFQQKENYHFIFVQ